MYFCSLRLCICIALVFVVLSFISIKTVWLQEQYTASQLVSLALAILYDELSQLSKKPTLKKNAVQNFISDPGLFQTDQILQS